MLRITPSTSAADAKRYYSRADYYEQEMVGQWHGHAAAGLGLQGRVDQESFNALCDNQKPQNGEKLTARTKNERRVLYDFTFDCPKSVSLMAQADERIGDAFRDSVRETMADIENEIAVRVRKGGKKEDRVSGNMIGAEFYHTTTRPARQDGKPDPHLHCHFVVFNASFDPEEKQWKAAELGRIKADANYWGAVAYTRLAEKLENLGYATRRTKLGFELQGVSDNLVKRFSRRTQEIEALAKQLGITNDEQKAKLGATSRLPKSEKLTAEQLKDYWWNRLSGEERTALGLLMARAREGSHPREDRSMAAVQYAIEHCFSRNSVVSERQFLTHALRHGVGAASVESAAAAMDGHDSLRWGERDGKAMVTTRQVAAEERWLVEFARRSRGTCQSLAVPGWVIEDKELNAGQRNAVRTMLESGNQVCGIIRGKAGAGKTRLLAELVARVEDGGKEVFAFAPSAEAANVLREEAKIANADTVARLLVDRQLRQAVAGQVVIIDEASQLSVPDMAKLFSLAEQLKFRVIISGDIRQHGSVERGAALKLLEEETGLKVAEVREIMRQRRADYRAAVQDLSDGRTEEGFAKLDAMGSICEVVNPEQRHRQIVADYVQAVEEGKSCLVVAPARVEGAKVTAAIREALKASGRLGADEREFSQLTSTDWTEAERGDAVNYDGGEVLVFQSDAKGGFKKGQRVKVEDPSQAPLDKAARFQAFREDRLRIAPNEMLRITRNGVSRDGHRLRNGMLVQVKGFTRDGHIKLSNGFVIDKDYGFLAPGYTLTSFSAQGKSPDRVIVAQSADSFPASSREQFYVSCSRGRDSCTVYTSDRAELLKAIARTDPKLTATELLRNEVRRQQQKQIRRQGLMKTVSFLQRLCMLGRDLVQRELGQVLDAMQAKVVVHER